MPQKGEDQTKTGILIGKIVVEGGQGLTGEDEAGVLGQPGVQEGSLLRLRAELGQAAGTAVAVAKKNHTNTRNVNIQQVQEILRTEGFVI